MDEDASRQREYFEHIHDSADHTPVVDPRLAPRVARKVRVIFENWASVSQKQSEIIGVSFP